MIQGMTPQEFGIFVSNGLIIPALFIILFLTLLRRDKKRDKIDDQRAHEARQREEDLRVEKEEAEDRLIAELKASRTAAIEREHKIREDGIKREALLKEEAAKREAMLMRGFEELTNAMHSVVNEIKEVKQDVRYLQDTVKADQAKEAQANEGH